MSSFAERLKVLMQQKSIGAAKLAEAVGLKAQAVYKWEKGGAITIENAAKVAQVLDVAPAYLLFGVEVEKIEPVSDEELIQVCQKLEPKYRSAIYRMAKGLQK
jgi:transcriptional regulator with XRE-family HTH domain